LRHAGGLLVPYLTSEETSLRSSMQFA
jgi:hypothetical protein